MGNNFIKEINRLNAMIIMLQINRLLSTEIKYSNVNSNSKFSKRM